MVEFESVRFKNVLSFGDNWTTIPINEHQHTLIVGVNGHGKTAACLDTINFALFGKPFRNINKPTFINSINEKELVVEVFFRVNDHAYMVRRGMKPTVFEIHRDGVPLDEDAAMKDTQKYLEEQILGFDEPAFRQVIVLGSTSFIPFMRLKAADRRRLVEDLLGIEVFSTMNALLKKRVAATNEQFTALSQQKTLAEERKRIAQEYHDKYRTQQQETLQAQIDQCTESIATISEAVAKLQPTAAKRQEVVDALQQTNWKIQEIDKGIRDTHKKIADREKAKQFYTHHHNCPTCEQSIDTEFRDKQMAAADKKILAYREMIANAESARPALLERAAALDKRREKIDAAVSYITSQTHVLQQTQRTLTQLERQLASVTSAPAPVDVSDTDAEIATLEAQLAVLSKERHVQELALKVLKDSGIKTKVIAHYLPIINRLANQYLASMDFPIQFTLDEQFEEHIQSRFRTKWSHDNFSDGQKKRIDLALLFTWRDIARIKNSCYTNLLIMDEVLDSSLDASGTEDLLKLLHAMPDDTRIFVISHKDAMVDKFAHVITFEMQKGFSQLKVLQ